MTEQDVEKKADTEGSGDTGGEDNRVEVKGIAWKTLVEHQWCQSP